MEIKVNRMFGIKEIKELTEKLESQEDNFEVYLGGGDFTLEEIEALIDLRNITNGYMSEIQQGLKYSGQVSDRVLNEWKG
mgnify:CR=1 FL=1